MTLEEARRILEGEVIAGADLNNIEVEIVCGADLMSDVLAFSKKGALLLTGLTNAHVVRTCGVAEIAAICFVRGKKPPAAVRCDGIAGDSRPPASHNCSCRALRPVKAATSREL